MANAILMTPVHISSKKNDGCMVMLAAFTSAVVATVLGLSVIA